MTPQLRPEIRPKTRLGGHSAAGPRSPKRRIKSRNRVTSACHVVGRVARNSGGLRPLPLGHGSTWITSQLSGACARGPVGGPVSSSPRPWRSAQLTWQTISGAVKRPQSGLRSGAKRPMRSRTASRALGSKSEGIARFSKVLSGTRRIAPVRFPQLNRIAFRIVETGKATVWVRFGINRDGDSRTAQLRGHRVKIANAKVHHPRTGPRCLPRSPWDVLGWRFRLLERYHDVALLVPRVDVGMGIGD